jgi:hypothetical protein
LVGNPEEKGTLERRRHSWEDNIRMNLREISYRPVAGSFENGNKASVYIKGGEFLY